MAAKEKPETTPKKSSPGKTLAKYDERLAAIAQKYKEQESTSSVGGGKFFRTSGGILKFDDEAVPNNRIPVIILDHVFENAYYEDEYDPDNPAAPVCFAFGRDEGEMEPHEQSTEKQHDKCASCPLNKFGSADKGRGKKCRNARRVAVIPAGSFGKNGDFKPITKGEHFKNVEVAYMKLPPTSIRDFSRYIKTLTANDLPPFAVITSVTVVPDEHSQYKFVFEALEEVDVDLIETLIARSETAAEEIDFPYIPMENDSAAGKKNAKKTGAKNAKQGKAAAGKQGGRRF